jgi:hypothetical protein
MKTIQTYVMKPLGDSKHVGPHVIKICEKRGIMALTTYFVSIEGRCGGGAAAGGLSRVWHQC